MKKIIYSLFFLLFAFSLCFAQTTQADTAGAAASATANDSAATMQKEVKQKQKIAKKKDIRNKKHKRHKKNNQVQGVESDTQAANAGQQAKEMKK